MKKVFVADWRNNYGLDFIVILADDINEARKIAIGYRFVWADSLEITELSIRNQKSGIIYFPENQS